MKKYSILAFTLFMSLNLLGQAGISDTEFLPSDNAMLEIKSGDVANPKGIRLPVFDAAQETNITDINAALSLEDRITQLEALLYYSEQSKQLMLHNGTEFNPIGVPLGGIIMWSGTVLPDGWVLCDGKPYDSNGNYISHSYPDGVSPNDPGPKVWRTPYLKGRFIIGQNPGDPDFGSSGNLSEGTKETRWGEGLEMNSAIEYGDNGTYRLYDETGSSGTDIIDHSYYVLAFIMRIK